jgi:hypothetical protein
MRVRLYLTADLPPATPTPDPAAAGAYRLAPPITDEIAWITKEAQNSYPYPDHDGDYYLRKAAALDRIALTDPADMDAAEEADAAAWSLIDSHPDWTTPYTPLPKSGDPRVIVRHVYRAWLRADLHSRGHCPNCEWLAHQCNCADHPDA